MKRYPWSAGPQADTIGWVVLGFVFGLWLVILLS